MKSTGAEILVCLQAVAAERANQQQDAALAQCTASVKAYQHARFAQTYADMLAHERYRGATLFFLENLYGPVDFTSRDDQFVRIVPALVRLFPREIVDTVLSLAQLHALSETLDGEMGRALRDSPGGGEASAALSEVLGAQGYARLWRQVGRAEERERQIVLMLQVGEALDAYTRRPLLRQSLRLMRAPAQAAGLGALQRFLERGFDTFRELRGAAEFLQAIAQRERALATSLFSSAV